MCVNGCRGLSRGCNDGFFAMKYDRGEAVGGDVVVIIHVAVLEVDFDVSVFLL